MAQHDQLYRRALYYDIALRRDVSREVAFTLDAYRHFTGTDPRSLLEIGCGPGYHARSIAREGLHVVGLDLSAPMLELAREQAEAEGVTLEWLVADMRSFRLDEPVDIAVCYFDGIDALLTNDDLVQHFRTVADNLNPNGLYLIDCTHPRDCSFRHYGEYRYTGERDGIQVDIIWATNQPTIDPITGVAEVGLEMHIRNNGHKEVIQDVARERCFTAQELNLLVTLSGAFRPVGWYGDFNLQQPLDNSPRSQRMIIALQKTGE